jgi:hypothetical protein
MIAKCLQYTGKSHDNNTLKKLLSGPMTKYQTYQFMFLFLDGYTRTQHSCFYRQETLAVHNLGGGRETLHYADPELEAGVYFVSETEIY